MAFNHDFVAIGCRPVEGNEQQMNVDRQAVHANDFIRVPGTHQFDQRFFDQQIALGGREAPSEMGEYTPVQKIVG